MKYSIIYSSQTGNTKLLAETILENLVKEDCEYIGPIKDVPSELIYIGFYTDKGNCHDDLTTYLKTLENKKIFLFGTAGFGESKEYFNRILANVKKNISDSNTIIGTYMCQGKMPMPVRQRYEKMAEDNPERFQPLIDNFDKALSHPDKNDLQLLINFITHLSQ